MKVSISQALLAKLEESERKRLEVFKIVLRTLADAPLVFKGGTALMLFYELDRFSDDLDFDAFEPFDSRPLQRMEETLSKALTPLGSSVSVHKSTPTVKRLKVSKPDISPPIKLEVSFGRVDKQRPITEKLSKPVFEAMLAKPVPQLRVYKISELLSLKLKAMEGRTAARDLYDVAFIVSHWLDKLETKAVVEAYYALSRKSLEDWVSEFEDAFLEDERLGEEGFWATYSRLISAFKLLDRKLKIEQPRTKLQNGSKSNPKKRSQNSTI